MRQRVPISDVRIDRPQREAALACTYALIIVAMSGVAGYLVQHYPLPIWGAARFNHDVWYAIGFKMGIVLAVPCAALYWAGYRVRDLVIQWEPKPVRIFYIAAGFVLGQAFSFGLLGTIQHEVQMRPAGEAVARVGLGLLLPLLTAALPEEIFYRAVLQSRLERLYGRWVAIFTTAVLFAAFHVPSRYFLASGLEGQAGDLPSVLAGMGISALIIGVLLSVLWDRYRSLPTLIALHWGLNALQSIASMLGTRF